MWTKSGGLVNYLKWNLLGVGNMRLTLKEAAEKAQMPPEDLLRCIDNNELIAECDSDNSCYHISEEDLEAFLGKRSFEAFWNNNNEDENKANEVGSITQFGNLRRVLTAEAVSELKIQHKVLISRVETLERLFSEFMEIEKTEQTLVLEESWKMEPTIGAKKNVQLPLDQTQGSGQTTDSVIPSDASPKIDTRDNAASERLTEPQTLNVNYPTTTNPTETPMGNSLASNPSDPGKTATDDIFLKAAKKDAPKPARAETNPKSEKDLLKKKATNASEHIRTIEENLEESAAAVDEQSEIEVDSPIALKLAEYERRLLEAKQTATQIWH